MKVERIKKLSDAGRYWIKLIVRDEDYYYREIFSKFAITFEELKKFEKIYNQFYIFPKYHYVLTENEKKWLEWFQWELFGKELPIQHKNFSCKTIYEIAADGLYEVNITE